jgi:hypothetical protein
MEHFMVKVAFRFDPQMASKKYAFFDSQLVALEAFLKG